jgi:hypothetical protein
MPEPTGTIILSLGKALVELLKAHAGFAEGDIVLRSPIEAEQTGKISLFLYQVQENPQLRNREPEPIGDNGLRPPPLALDLYYLVTPLAQQAETALGHLEAVMLAFYDQPVLKPPLLGPTLVDAGNEAVQVFSHALSLEDTNRLWGIFPNKPYRLSVAYLVTPVQVPSGRIIPITRVAERVTRISRLGNAT